MIKRKLVLKRRHRRELEQVIKMMSDSSIQPYKLDMHPDYSPKTQRFLDGLEKDLGLESMQKAKTHRLISSF
jgi:hypothetical protein